MLTTRRARLAATAVGLVLVFWVPRAEAVDIAVYDAGVAGIPAIAPDPVTQDWILDAGSNPGLSWGPVSPDGATGLNAWNTTDNTTAGGQFVTYEHVMTDAEHALADTEGWRFTVVLRFVDSFGCSAPGCVAIPMQYGRLTGDMRRWLIFFGLTPTGDLMVRTFGGNGADFVVTAGGTGTGDYHTVVMESTNPGIDDQVTVTVDGAILQTDYTGQISAFASGGPEWGTGSSAGQGAANFNFVRMEVDPTCQVDPPTDLTCTSMAEDVELAFTNNGPYPGGIEIYRDEVLIDTIADPAATTYVDVDLCLGTYAYEVKGLDASGNCGALAQTCTVDHGFDAHSSVNVPLPIPDDDPLGVVDTIDFLDDIIAMDVDVRVQIAHIDIGDLSLDVSSPSGTTVTLKSLGGAALDNIDVTFDDAGVPFDVAQLPNGLFMAPQGPGLMADFAGEAMQGIWSLEVVDIGVGSLGQLESWTVLETTSAVCPIGPPMALSCAATAGSVELTWDNGGNAYSSIEVIRDDDVVAVLGGTDTAYTDSPPADVYTYRIRGFSSAVSPCCTATSDGCFAAAGVTDLVWAHPDQDGGATDDGASILTALANNGVVAASVEELPATLSVFERVWVVLGTFTPNHVLTPSEGQILFDYCIVDGGNVYVSGSDTWGFDAATPFDSVDGVDSLASEDGSSDLFDLTGLDSGQGLDLSEFVGEIYDGENNWIDHLALDDAGLIWQNAGNGDPVGSFHDGAVSGTAFPGDYKVICTSWEFGGFAGDRDLLMSRYLDVFSGVPPQDTFLRGDADGDGNFTGIVDGLFILNFQFVAGAAEPPCMKAADADDSGTFSGLSDGLYVLSFQFAGGPAPQPPFPDCGADPTADGLSCETTLTCP